MLPRSIFKYVICSGSKLKNDHLYQVTLLIVQREMPSDDHPFLQCWGFQIVKIGNSNFAILSGLN